MKSTSKGIPINWKIAVGVVAVILIVRVIAAFPVIRFYDARIPLFSAERLVSITPLIDIVSGGGRFHARVLGTHVLQTEHGTITLKNFAKIASSHNTVLRIDEHNFEEGRAAHNLEIYGIRVPPNLSISFNDRHQFSMLTLGRQEISVSGLPFMVRNIGLRGRLIHLPAHARVEAADITLEGRPKADMVTLADSTQLDVSRISGGLHIFKSDDLWRLLTSTTSFLFAKRSGESEFTRYRSVTFRPHWGEVIEMEPFE